MQQLLQQHWQCWDRGGMIGGVIFLGIIGLASDSLSKYGLEALLKGIYQKRLLDGESEDSLIQEIRGLPVSKELKLILKDEICPSF